MNPRRDPPRLRFALRAGPTEQFATTEHTVVNSGPARLPAGFCYGRLVPLPDFVAAQSKKLLDAFCERRIPPHVRDQVRLVHDTRGNVITLSEMRPPWDGSEGDWSKNPIARFSFDAKTGQWVLRWFDRNSKSHKYERVEPTKNLEALLDELDRDPTCIFWG